MHVPLYAGEFGLKIRYHVPRVYAAMCAARRTGEPTSIEIEPGEEALYPAADTYIVRDRDPDEIARMGRGRPRLPRTWTAERRFRPTPYQVRSAFPAQTSVVICPRQRPAGASKNWTHWPWLAQTLMARGIPTFAAGIAEASDTRVACDAAWYYDRPLDATIHAMRQADLVIATDAGLAHLAVLCGASLLLITYRDRVAPGPVIDSHGRRVQADYWPVRWQEYYVAANHTGAGLRRIDGWEHRDAVVQQTGDLLHRMGRAA